MKKFEKLANDYVVSLYPASTMTRVFYWGLKDSIGFNGLTMLEYFKDHNVVFYIKPDEWKATHNHFVGRIENEPNFLENIFEKTSSSCEQLLDYSEKIPLDLSKLSNDDLWKIYDEYEKLNFIAYSYGLLLPLLDFQGHTYLSDRAKKILAKRVSGEKLTQYFSLLTTPTKKTFNKKQEIDLYKILKKINETEKLKTLFLNNNIEAILKELKLTNPELYKKIEEHTKKYNWVYYVYQGPASTEEYFVEILKDWVKKDIEPTRAIEANYRSIEELKAEQEKAISKLKLSDEDRAFIDLTRESVFLKPWRRDMQSHTYYLMERVVFEIASRLSLTLEQIRMMLPQEVERALRENFVDKKIIDNRMKNCVYSVEDNKELILCADDAIKYVKENMNDEEEIKVEMVEEFRGTVACAGEAKGVVRIINSPIDIEKMKDKDILISFATNPNLMPAIRKAAAIVTDEGGLTCHAAIVSRELRIPCIVGTRIATKVLKDGDLVEVDANKGIIKIIKN